MFTLTFLFVFFIIYYLTKGITIINVLVNFIDKTKIEIIIKYRFFKERRYVFLISEIKNYQCEYGTGYKIFYLNRNKGTNFKFLILTEIENLKSFENFYEQLKNNIEKYNKEDSLYLIKEKTNIYQTKLGLFYGIILFIILLAIPICYIVLQTKINIGFLLIIYPTGILFLWRLFIEQKKRN
ncbi:hypothetical protein [uncultured Flavobacterium sp.]|uniref:hypothetical protein n=1 Tax=uncultured Flavobacterium sp. TaxID=165435 RepID=UPI0030816DC8